MIIPIQSISRLLPQTQCRECGHEGCLPCARTLSVGEAPVNLCAPGGETVMEGLADLLGKPYLVSAETQIRAMALIDESACIGCTTCVRTYPVGAIMNASKLMYIVISGECTGCSLCATSYPVDCVNMAPVPQSSLSPARRFSTPAKPHFTTAKHAQSRFERHTARRQRDDAECKALLVQRETAVKAKQAARAQTQIAVSNAAFNSMDLIAEAMAKAQSQRNRLVVSDNRGDLKARRIEEAKERAELYRARRDAKYDNKTEGAVAVEFLRRHRAKQEAAKEAR